MLFTYFHLAADRELTEAVCRSGVTALAYETIEVNSRLPLLEPMSEIAGRMSMLVGVAGVLPGRVMVLVGGVAGVNAARMATGLNADVTILEQLPRVDLLIGAVLVPGAKAPKLISHDMLRCMRPGSVLVDIAIDQGGCAETSRPTNHHAPVFVEEGVTHMPAAYSRTATQALTNVTHRYVEMLANHGLAGACALALELVGGHQHPQRPTDLPSRWPSAWPRVAGAQAVNRARLKVAQAS